MFGEYGNDRHILTSISASGAPEWLAPADEADYARDGRTLQIADLTHLTSVGLLGSIFCRSLVCRLLYLCSVRRTIYRAVPPLIVVINQLILQEH